ncbi:MAG: hypothetical protein ACR2GY_11580 [Phycisphaerales bacterium]
MQQPLTVIMLAGAIRRSPLRAALDEPALCLPMTSDTLLLDVWIAAIAALGPVDIRIVVNDARDATSIKRHLDRAKRRFGHEKVSIRIIEESAAWRGTGGVVIDTAGKIEQGQLVLVVEAGCLPPASLEGVMNSIGDECAMVVAGDESRTPAGIFVLRGVAFQFVNPVGYSDLKEQLITALRTRHHRVGFCELPQPVIRIRDRESYLRAVARGAEQGADQPQDRTHRQGRVLGCSIVGSEVECHQGAIIHESVVLKGARIGANALVSRSVIGRGVRVAAGARVTETVLDHHASARGQQGPTQHIFDEAEGNSAEQEQPQDDNTPETLRMIVPS